MGKGMLRNWQRPGEGRGGGGQEGGGWEERWQWGGGDWEGGNGDREMGRGAMVRGEMGKGRGDAEELAKARSWEGRGRTGRRVGWEDRWQWGGGD